MKRAEVLLLLSFVLFCQICPARAATSAYVDIDKGTASSLTVTKGLTISGAAQPSITLTPSSGNSVEISQGAKAFYINDTTSGLPLLRLEAGGDVFLPQNNLILGETGINSVRLRNNSGDLDLSGVDLTLGSNMRARVSGQNRFRHLNSMAKATNTGSQSVADQTVTIMTWDTDEYDTDNIHSTSSNTSRFVANIAGKYLLECNLRYNVPASSVGSAHVGWRLNGNAGSDKNIAAIPISSTMTLIMVNAAVPVSLAANDYVEFWAYGSNLTTLTVSQFDSFGAMSYIGE